MTCMLWGVSIVMTVSPNSPFKQRRSTMRTRANFASAKPSIDPSDAVMLEVVTNNEVLDCQR